MSACFWSGCDERSSEPLADWTTGAEAIVYQSCAACGSLQYFRRSFCCACGAPDPVEKRASGEGTVYATSLVCRAATPETRAHIPYNIVLVDTAEGFRMMAHGDNDLAIGDKVTARFAPFAGQLVPYFEKANWTAEQPVSAGGRLVWRYSIPALRRNAPSGAR